MAAVDMKSVRARLKTSGRDPRLVARIVLGMLVAANLIAAVIVLKPWAGSAEELDRQASSLRSELNRKQAQLQRLRNIVSKVESARGDGDTFMDGYLLSRRSVSSRLLLDLDGMARKAGIRQKEISFVFEPVEGSDTLSKATITGNYEGAYGNLIQFLNLVDRSPRLLIIESLAATPQPQGFALNTTMKFNAFVREGGNAPEEPQFEDMPAPVAAAPPPVVQPAPPLVRPAPRMPGTAPDTAPRGFRPGLPPNMPRAVQVPPQEENPEAEQENPGIAPPAIPFNAPRILRDRLLRPQRRPPVESKPE